MAEIGLGYGSEFQLLRFLGHHRQELDQIIQKELGVQGEIKWLDFGYNKQKISLDAEIKGIEFLSDHPKYEVMKKSWSDYWTGNTQNWDAVFILNGKYYIVEAKAHIGELESQFGGQENKNKEKIEKAFNETAEELGASTTKDWFGNYYQLANRLAFTHYLNKEGINAGLVYIYFIDGYKKRVIEGEKVKVEEDKGVKTKEEWLSAIRAEYKELGIDESKIKKHICNIFINCEK
ncbi:MAG: hypothetical protein AMQ74_01255 [Candidatus Methanofastidiosum methylothiophilum]|uniref:Uncharacterized protein n=1 Tax=Candidatus Methanofastidiosum methylothiophilum TaxID=1705564 RepID=A0A150IZL4_9EURY|nr:MAG: hypothetical protein AMQ74_01255 [Candidatus Methanofastidiosum methylthiophilus]